MSLYKMRKRKDIVTFIEKNAKKIFTALLLLQCIVIIIFGYQKEWYHVDEMLTFEGSAHSGYPMRYWDLGDDFYNQEHTHDEFIEWLTTEKSSIVLNQGMTETIDAIVNRNLYYTIINMASTVSKGIPTKWTGIYINLLFFLATQIILFKLTDIFTNRKVCSILATGIYGFSAGAISTVLYIRCYMIVTFLSVFISWLLAKFLREQQIRKKLICLFGLYIAAFLSYRIHMFSMVHLGLIFFVLLLYLLWTKSYKYMKDIFIAFGIPVILAVLCIGAFRPQIFPMYIMHARTMFLNNKVKEYGLKIVLKNIKRLMGVIGTHLFFNAFICAVIMFLCIIALIYIFYKWKRLKKEGMEWKKDTLILMPVAFVVFFLIFFLIEGVHEWRYTSSLYPYIILMVVILIWYMIKNSVILLKYRTQILGIIVCTFMLITGLSYNGEHISELYVGWEEQQSFFEDNYHGVNGIMVHHDMQGYGYNWLYEAASLWPQDSNVLIIQKKVLENKEFSYQRNDEMILLWLTVDYDNEKILSLIREQTDYEDIRLVYNTGHLLIYECNK